jgi:hypothetical protein
MLPERSIKVKMLKSKYGVFISLINWYNNISNNNAIENKYDVYRSRGGYLNERQKRIKAFIEEENQHII